MASIPLNKSRHINISPPNTHSPKITSLTSQPAMCTPTQEDGIRVADVQAAAYSKLGWKPLSVPSLHAI